MPAPRITSRTCWFSGKPQITPLAVRDPRVATEPGQCREDQQQRAAADERRAPAAPALRRSLHARVKRVTATRRGEQNGKRRWDWPLRPPCCTFVAEASTLEVAMMRRMAFLCCTAVAVL